MKFLKWVVKLLRIGIIAVIVLTLAALVYEKAAEYADSKKYEPPGKIIDVDEQKMHIYAEGTGDVTVVFVSGLGTPSPYIDFYPIYSEISEHARIVVYDRPGYGWSEVSSSSRDIDTVTNELHQLLELAGEKPPYLLVGHSMGSLESIRYAQLYREEVKGIVTIDGGSPEFYAKESISDEVTSSLGLQRVLKNMGVIRLLFNHSPNFYNSAYFPRNFLTYVPEELHEVDKALYLKNMFNKNVVREDNHIKVNAETVLKDGRLEDIPLRILTAEEEATLNEKWKSSQEAFIDWSTDSTQVIVDDTKHYMHQFAPEEINEVIISLLEEVK
ncbi:alpha/beta fold hydrolase [Vallitalea okinawensis]|uniref:alpha/beta fold hydrolase n=1 Tax=Vallitalea okinawensis TaxID=2078660 RepID=UPI001FA91ABD|nr:alpha/beta hydrolase [Vallitalea okinawensis]